MTSSLRPFTRTFGTALALRHSFASRALSLGESLPMIGKLLGHRKVQTTARYAHLARDSVKAAAERVSNSLAVDLDTPSSVSL